MRSRPSSSRQVTSHGKWAIYKLTSPQSLVLHTLPPQPCWKCPLKWESPVTLLEEKRLQDLMRDVEKGKANSHLMWRGMLSSSLVGCPVSRNSLDDRDGGRRRGPGQATLGKGQEEKRVGQGQGVSGAQRAKPRMKRRRSERCGQRFGRCLLLVFCPSVAVWE